MIKKIGHVTLFIRDEEEALDFYVGKLGFEKRSDIEIRPGARWLTIAPNSESELEVVLQKPDPILQGEEGARRIEERIGQSPMLIFQSDDLRRDFELWSENGVKFLGQPEEKPWGLEVSFLDLYGNSFKLFQTPDHPVEE